MNENIHYNDKVNSNNQSNTFNSSASIKKIDNNLAIHQSSETSVFDSNLIYNEETIHKVL